MYFYFLSLSRLLLLDLIITNKRDLVFTEVVPNLISDLDLIGTKININKPRRQPPINTFRKLRNYSKYILCNSVMSEYQFQQNP